MIFLGSMKIWKRIKGKAKIRRANRKE